MDRFSSLMEAASHNPKSLFFFVQLYAAEYIREAGVYVIHLKRVKATKHTYLILHNGAPVVSMRFSDLRSQTKSQAENPKQLLL